MWNDTLASAVLKDWQNRSREDVIAAANWACGPYSNIRNRHPAYDDGSHIMTLQQVIPWKSVESSFRKTENKVNERPQGWTARNV